MRYAIIINLDYETNSQPECAEVWEHLRRRMLGAGFRMEGRAFTINADEQEACELARRVIDAMDEEALLRGKGMYTFLKEFYGFDQTRTVNLLVPPTDTIEIEIQDL